MTGTRFFTLAFLMLGLWAVTAGVVKAVEGFRALSWPEAPGRIIMFRVDEIRTSQKIRIARLCLNIDYLYQVGDKIYEGHRLNTGWKCFGSEKRIRELSARYPTGRAVQVRYDPAEPERSLLEPGLDWSIFFLWGVGIITLSVAWPLYRKSRIRTRF
ncbi:MAG TPA: DUF3592 domain-containing protein [Thermodesulfobacteriaceae bacterium]|nr:DUF3592 domain-containing protein [Thermodesulfobacteriaceae bacterium]